MKHMSVCICVRDTAEGTGGDDTGFDTALLALQVANRTSDVEMDPETDLEIDTLACLQRRLDLHVCLRLSE